MSVPTREAAEAKLRSHFPAFYEIVTEAWADYPKYPEELRRHHNLITRAAIISCHMISRAATYAQTLAGLRIHESQQLKLLVIDNYAIRFKKLNYKMRSSNHPTQQVLDFRGQLPLLGFDDTHNIEVGYVFDEFSQTLEGVFVVCPSADGYHWAIELARGSSASSIDTLFPHQPSSPDVDSSDILPRKIDKTNLPDED